MTFQGADSLVKLDALGNPLPCARPDEPTDIATISFLSSSKLVTSESSGTNPTDAFGQIRGIESHGFCVSRLPPGAIRLAYSSSCENEVFALGESVLALQCHPEFTLEVVDLKLWPSVVERHGRLTSEEASDARASFLRTTTNEALRTFVRRFCDF